MKLGTTLTAVSLFALSAFSAQAAETEFVTKLDPAANELPEGLALRGTDAFLGLATKQSVLRLAEGELTEFATYPSLPEGAGFLTGLTFAQDGSLWAGLASFAEGVTTGIYRVGAEGGEATLHASAEGMGFPNDFTWQNDGTALVTDSIAGVIWAVSEDGSTTKWLEHPLLKGDPEVCAPDEVGYGIGANGLDFGPDGALYVAVTDRAQVLRVAIEDGKPSHVAPVNETNCDLLEGIDGIIAGPEGITAAVNRTNQMSFISYEGEVSSISRDNMLDFPASIAATDTGYLVTNFGLVSAMTGNANPGLIKITK
ncbi:SMP-30/gluconolactonase/LRE family protein [Pseudovibrio exalbescens]|nr:SMP-30/gluconolactonase/LRE family protein [Pseudovibrio exalbescens]MDD7909284.1 SMP-30/gluconolactonase/LRE family protein [Pseudovibrio exalbescens]